MHRTAITTLFSVVLLVALAAPALAQERTFVSPMSGDEEVPPVETDASGDAEYVVSADGTEVSFRVDVANLENTTMAHIHLGAAGENGPPVVWLHSQEQAPELVEGVTTGTLVSGTFTADDLVGPLEGGTLADLVDAMAAGNTYTNVHTQENEAGEIRGQITEVAAETEEEAEAEEEEAERPTAVDAGSGGAADRAGAVALAWLALAGGFVALIGGAALFRRHRATA